MYCYHCVVRKGEIEKMAAADDRSSLKDVFEQGFLLHYQIEESDEPSKSEAFQVVF